LPAKPWLDVILNAFIFIAENPTNRSQCPEEWHLGRIPFHQMAIQTA
jgi:hypothetical protein